MGATEKNNELEPFLDSNCKPMTLTAQTKFGLTFGQLITLITYTILVVSLYFDVRSRIEILETDKQSQARINEKLIDTIDRIDKSTIRIEGKLDLKQDKNWTK